MVYFQRKIKCQFVGDAKYLPEGMPTGKMISVIGYETRRREKKNNQNDRVDTVEDIIFICIGDNRKLIKVAEFNCIVQVDEQAELSTSRAAEMLQNATTMLKVYSEKVAQLPDSKP